MIFIDNSVRYSVYYPDSAEEFARLIPDGGTTVRLPSETDADNEEVHTVALFHQLYCLGLIRADYAANQSTALSEHCMNYLRQVLLCAADTKLESVRAEHPPNIVTLAGDYECRDWSVVYKAAEANQRNWYEQSRRQA